MGFNFVKYREERAHKQVHKAVHKQENLFQALFLVLGGPLGLAPNGVKSRIGRDMENVCF